MNPVAFFHEHFSAQVGRISLILEGRAAQFRLSEDSNNMNVRCEVHTTEVQGTLLVYMSGRAGGKTYVWAHVRAVFDETGALLSVQNLHTES